jgi:hypothetical protein
MRGTSIIRGTMLAQRKTRLRFNALLSGVSRHDCGFNRERVADEIALLPAIE